MLTRILASPRRRRRALRIGLLLAAAGTVAGVAIAFAGENGGKLPAAHAGSPQLVPPEPDSVPFGPQQAAVEQVARQFVTTAVYRHNVGASYDLVTPTLREGLTRAQWAKGEIPVVPYPAEAVKSVRWDLGYSYRDHVELRLAILAKSGASAQSQRFNIELKAAGTGKARHWLVESWTPAGSPSTPQRPPSAGPAAATIPTQARLGRTWVLVPIGVVLGLIVLVPLGLGVRGWARDRRARNAYGRSSL